MSTKFEFGSISINPRVNHSFSEDGESKVIDGDTLKIGGERWRLYGFDAPPIGGNCCNEEREKGELAKKVLEALLLLGGRTKSLNITIRAIPEPYRRKLVSISVAGEDVGEILREFGLAEYFDGSGPKPVFCQCAVKKNLHGAQSRLFDLRQERRSARKQR